MKIFILISIFCFVAPITSCNSISKNKNDTNISKLDASDLYGQLFAHIQMAPLFEDSKYFVDMEPLFSPESINMASQKLDLNNPIVLKEFVFKHFAPPLVSESQFESNKKDKIEQHIQKLWRHLKREPDTNVNPASSLIPLPYSYIVPGGRFREIYYWDSYFVQLGLLADNEEQLFKDVVKNFAFLLNTYGRIPNGNRDYYRGRSQPPFFSLMIALWKDRFGVKSALEFLPALQTEHDFWMSDKRVVQVEPNAYLNRYWDDFEKPRPEAYKEDINLALEAKKTLKRPMEKTFRELRAGAESGWDYSSRWFADSNVFASIQTTSLIPIDLNALLYHLELQLAEFYTLSKNNDSANKYKILAEKRKNLINKYLWDEASGTYRDYNWKSKSISPQLTIAMIVPLFTNLADYNQAKQIEKVVLNQFLKPGGLVTSLHNTGQQWDAPNGWPPHQWMAYAGLKRYGLDKTAEKIKDRWLMLNKKVFKNTGKMMEKYNVIDIHLPAGGGEYPLQDGFGWTNGVFRALQTSDNSLKHLF
ncbi:MAG: alpha,alpha-trehalase TreF [Bdellovibrionaceae bacterium]|nr:alpha,alpha-trehalase TreF [Pseudobdellovibrionaceae bacterium]